MPNIVASSFESGILGGSTKPMKTSTTFAGPGDVSLLQPEISQVTSFVAPNIAPEIQLQQAKSLPPFPDSALVPPSMNDNLPSLPASPLFNGNSLTSLDNEVHGRLMHHFIEVLSRWLDVCDPDLHFARVAPQQAMESPILLGAILSLSAWHLSKVSDFDERISDQLYHETLNALIPTLNDTTALVDDRIFAATLTMHVLEELRETSQSNSLHGHLIGIKIFIDSERTPRQPRGFRQAAWVLALRQEVHDSLISQRAPQWPVSHCRIDRSFTTTDDDTWALRILANYADVLSFCLGNESQTPTRWKELYGYGEMWRALLPSSFRPYLQKEPSWSEKRVFPIQRYFRDCHGKLSYKRVRSGYD
jgi:hypothetical protein